MFELLTPETRVIVPLTSRRLVLHGVRNMSTLAEESPQTVGRGLGLTPVDPLPFKSMEEVLARCQGLSPAQGEGFVVVFGDWQRCKVKAPAYVATALLPKSAEAWRRADEGARGARGGGGGSSTAALNDVRLLEIAKIGESAEFCAAFPLVATRLTEVVALWEKFVEDCQETFFRVVCPAPAGDRPSGGGGGSGQDGATESEGEVWKRCSQEGLDKFVLNTLMNVRRSGSCDVRGALIRADSKALAKVVFQQRKEAPSSREAAQAEPRKLRGAPLGTQQLTPEEKADKAMAELLAEEEEDRELKKKSKKNNRRR